LSTSSTTPIPVDASRNKATDVLPPVVKKEGFHPPLAVGVEDAAHITGLSVNWLNQLRSKGAGPRYLKVGRRALYLVADLEAWLTANAVARAAA
jgi:predicted DNA-binding transcriptional regulator AlpA